MIRQGALSADELRDSLAHAILLIARTRGHIAVRGRADATQLTKALAALSAATARASSVDSDVLRRGLPSLVDGLGSLIEEMAECGAAAAVDSLHSPSTEARSALRLA